MWALGWLVALLDFIRSLFHEVADFAFMLLFLIMLIFVVWLTVRPLVWFGNRLMDTAWWRRRFGYRYSGGDLVGMTLVGLIVVGPIALGIALYAVGILPVR